jgi:hypothetical protein
MIIIRGARALDLYPSRLFLLSLDSTYGHYISTKALNHVGWFLHAANTVVPQSPIFSTKQLEI